MTASSLSSILLIEDDLFKQELIEDLLTTNASVAEISVARSVQQAVARLGEQAYDLVILDMALPSHESKPGGAQPISQLSGGIEILLQLSFEARSDPVIILTQYPEIEFDGSFFPLAKARRAIGSKLHANILDIIHFNAADHAWTSKLLEKIG